MKKITILILALFFGFEMQSQVAISKNPYYGKPSKFEMERFDDFKNTDRLHNDTKIAFLLNIKINQEKTFPGNKLFLSFN